MNKSCKIATVLFIVFLASIWTAYASYTIYSNIVTVDANYTFTLTQSLSGSDITLTAHLEKTSSPVPSVTITFYTCDSVGAILSVLGPETTDVTGTAVHTVTLTTPGIFYYKAGYVVP